MEDSATNNQFSFSLGAGLRNLQPQGPFIHIFRQLSCHIMYDALKRKFGPALTWKDEPSGDVKKMPEATCTKHRSFQDSLC